MAVTRLERKGRKNKSRAKARVKRIKSLNEAPIVRNVDIEAIKAEFANKAAKPAKKEEPKAEVVEDTVVEKAEVVTEAAAPEMTEEPVAEAKEEKAEAVKEKKPAKAKAPKKDKEEK